MKSSPLPAQLAGVSELRIGDVRVELRYHRIIRPDERVELPQRMFDLLLVFLAEPGVLHTRKDLFNRLWPDVVVEDSNLSQSVWMLRKALGGERKHWIRTVSKNGYIFEPPVPIEIIDDTKPPAPALVSETTGSSEKTSTSAPCSAEAIEHAPSNITTDARPGRSWRFSFRNPDARQQLWFPIRLSALFAIFLVTLVALTSSSGSGGRQSIHGTRAAAPVVVVILQEQSVSGGNSHSAMQWPIDLLDDWLSWKLDVLPEVLRLDPNSTTAGAAHAMTRLVVLSSEVIPDENDGVILRAHLKDSNSGGRVETFMLRGNVTEVPAMVDKLSQQILARLLPQRADAKWPALTLDFIAAEHYAKATAAIRQRKWNDSDEDMQKVIAAAPGFGLAHLRLVELKLRRGNLRESHDHMAKAQRELTPIPSDSKRILDAYAASFDPRRQLQALEAYRRLAQDYPQRPDFALKHARLLSRAGHSREALGILSGQHWQWDQSSLPTRIDHGIVLSETELAAGYPVRGRHTAQNTLQLIDQAGAGWELELGKARLLVARAHHNEPGRERSPELFELAATSFDTAGANLDALYSRYLAEYARAETGDDISARMQTLLAEARALGHASLEIELLRRAAYRHYNSGEHAKYRMHLQEALLAANASGDITQQRLLDLDLLNEDMLMGNDASAETRIERLQQEEIQGEKKYWVIEFSAAILTRKGQYREALEELRQNEIAASDAGRMPAPGMSAARLTCTRADILIAKGDVAAARPLLDQCRIPEDPLIRLTAQMLEATADILDNDLAHARIILDKVEPTVTAMPNSVDHWITTITTGALLTRVGEYERAKRLYTAALPSAEKAGYQFVVAHLEVGLAEIAAAQKDRALSRKLIDTARRRVSPDSWGLISRIETLEIVDAMTSGNVKAAEARIAALRKQAEQFDDQVVVAQMNDLAAKLPSQSRETTTVRHSVSTHLRGATLDWLIATPGYISDDVTPAVAAAQ